MSISNTRTIIWYTTTDFNQFKGCFFYNSIVVLTYKQNAINNKNKNNTETGRNQNSSLLLLVNSKAERLKLKHFLK